ncbi:hypothetical protein ACE38W_01990 [Chitinophaga sp. Hz27]|uniref:hypothetical protein n=1 Tax=Chitinophaga sp. Hz27 TaxID=3347169 RepID=UPI0035DF79FE
MASLNTPLGSVAQSASIPMPLMAPAPDKSKRIKIMYQTKERDLVDVDIAAFHYSTLQQEAH